MDEAETISFDHFNLAESIELCHSYSPIMRKISEWSILMRIVEFLHLLSIDELE